MSKERKHMPDERIARFGQIPPELDDEWTPEQETQAEVLREQMKQWGRQIDAVHALAKEMRYTANLLLRLKAGPRTVGRACGPLANLQKKIINTLDQLKTE